MEDEGGPNSHSLEITPSQQAGVLARDFVTGVLARGVASPAALDDVLLVISELVSNALRHGGGGVVWLTVEIEEDVVRVDVADSGPGFRAEEVAGRPGSRFGLRLVAAVASACGNRLEGGRHHVWCEIPRRRAR